MTRKLLQLLFEKGSPPKNLNGFYKGKLELFIPINTIERIGALLLMFWLPWYGKNFYYKYNKGDNVIPQYMSLFIRSRFGKRTLFKKETKGMHVFPFKTHITKALRDRLSVLQLDYNLPENPPKVRQIIDELVEIDNHTYLGKAYIKTGKKTRLVAFFSLQQ